MTEPLSNLNFLTQAEELSVQIIEDIQRIHEDVDLVVLPSPNMAVLEEYNFTPDHLRDAGEDVPDDEDEAFEFAVNEFRNSDLYHEWENGIRPGDAGLYLWPLELNETYDETVGGLVDNYDHQALADSILGEKLECCYVNGEHQGRTYRGFILIGGGMDLSADLAMAYVLAGQLPPHALLPRAVQNTRNDDWRETLLDCMVQGQDYLNSQVYQYQQTLDLYRPAAPALT